jgi:5-methylthioadenosine/S-adenosylhomocysteine deaminase
VYAARGGDVSTSIINGQIVMENRELRTLDRERVMEDVHRLARAICAELPDAVGR